MSVRLSVILLSSILIATLPSLSQDQPLQPSHLPQPRTPSSNDEVLSNELMRMQMELSRIAQDMDSVDAKMTQGIANKPPSGNSKIISEAHELLTGYGANSAIKVFLDSSSSGIRWESCLKISKLYRGLLDKVFELNKGRNSGEEKTRMTLSGTDESPELVQLVFLARMMTELQLRYSELQPHLAITPDAKQEELWRGLREAVQNDDRIYLEKLKALLAQSSVPPRQFAARVVLDVRKTNQTAAATVVEGMAMINSGEDLWRLSEIPGINPDFIRSLDCDKKAMKEFFATGSDTAFVQVRYCRKSADGASILAFDTKPSDPVKSSDVGGKTQPNFRELSQHPDIFHLPTGEFVGDPLNPNKGDTRVGAELPPAEDKGAAFGAAFTAPPQPKIPSWWIRCMCPNDHPDAGMLVSGVRWHAPVLQCPNPEIRRYEVK